MNNNNNELLECTILVCSCDNYSDLWLPFFKLLKKNWSNCPCKIVLNTESKVYSYSGLNIECYSMFKNQIVPYGKRMIEHLKKISTPYVLVLMDDFFVRKKVNEQELVKVIKWLKSDKNIASFSFQHYKDDLNCRSKKYLGYEMRPQYGEYKFNFQAAIWKKDILIKSWRKHETPWEWETIANYRTFDNKWKFYVIGNDFNSPIDYGFNHSGMGIYRGKWVLESVKDIFEENDIVVDFNKRGIYRKEEKNIQRMVKNNILTAELRKIKSLGIFHYAKIFMWRIKQKVLKLFKRNYSSNYIKFMRRKCENKICY